MKPGEDIIAKNYVRERKTRFSRAREKEGRGTSGREEGGEERVRKDRHSVNLKSEWKEQEPSKRRYPKKYHENVEGESRRPILKKLKVIGVPNKRKKSKRSKMINPSSNVKVDNNEGPSSRRKGQTGGKREERKESKPEEKKSGRLRRENHIRVKHDKLFCDWKVLVGPTDWEDHAQGKEGATRYHIHNMPQTCFGPGVYELGIIGPSKVPKSSKTSASIQDSRKPSRKLRKEDVVVVYVGQAENVRQRLQRYGQGGSHLGPKIVVGNKGEVKGKMESAISSLRPDSIDENHIVGLRSWYTAFGQKIPGNGESSGQQIHVKALKVEIRQARPEGLNEVKTKETNDTWQTEGLFTEVFARGYYLVFRWARASNKEMAKEVELKLLNTFDYAWNHQHNEERRPEQVLSLVNHVRPIKNYIFCCIPPPPVGLSLPLQHPDQETTPWKDSSKTGFPANPQTKIKVKVKVKVKDESITAGKQRVVRNASDESSPGVGIVGSDCGKCTVPGGDYCSKSSPGRRNTRGRISMYKEVSIVPTKESMVVLPPGEERIVMVRDPTMGGNKCGASLGHGNPCSNKPVKGRKRCALHKGVKVFAQVVRDVET